MEPLRLLAWREWLSFLIALRRFNGQNPKFDVGA
jgi:hypothetical protein